MRLPTPTHAPRRQRAIVFLAVLVLRPQGLISRGAQS